jgi:chondroitin 4-sulfotransferase 11
MISHLHRCIFIHVPKTAGKSVLTLFGLPELGVNYRGDLPHIEDPYDHIPIMRYVPRPFFGDYFKFAFVRNPWDRLVSAFHYLNGGGANPHDLQFRDRYLRGYGGEFRAFVQDLPQFLKAKHFMPQSRLVCDEDGRVLVDYVGRFEALDKGMAVVAGRTGIAEVSVPHTNASRHARYTDYYDSATRQRVAEVYARDIRLFGYEYES